MFEFTSLFFNNLFGIAGASLVPTIAPIATMGTGTSTIHYGVEVSDENLILGTSLTTSATTTMGVIEKAYSESISQLEDTQAYIESLSEEELSELVCKLETKDFSVEVFDNEVTLIKKIDGV